MATPTSYRPLPGSERPQLPNSQEVGILGAAERVTVTVLLRQKPGSPEVPDLQYWQDTLPNKREYLSEKEFLETYGEAEEDAQVVINYLKSMGLGVERHAGHRRVVAHGSAAEVNAAFGVTLKQYRAPRRTAPSPRQDQQGRPFGAHAYIEEHVHRGFEGPAYLPSKLIGIVTGVIGLDNRRLGAAAGVGTGDPPGAVYMSPAAIAQSYNFPTSLATGQTIGLFEDSAAGAGYLVSDINKFLESLPGGLATPLPVLHDISSPGSQNNTGNVTFPLNPFTGGAVFECIIDVSIAAAAAPGANINVYFTTNDEPGWDWFFHRATHPLPGENPPSVLSASWVAFFRDDSGSIATGSIGDPSTPGTPAHNFHQHLRHAAARGITVLMALGDWGSNNQVNEFNLFNGLPPDASCHVSYPNADPWVTSCGGTILGQTNPSPPPILDEQTWSEANIASPFQNFPYESTGGGVSDTFDRPPYQIAGGVLPISKNDGKIRRGLPDVSGMVAMNGFYIAGVGGPGNNGGFGTSAVSPLYAGLVATINAFLGRNVGFLNPTLYTYGAQICNDITVGNNYSGNVPDAPAYTAAVGWDPCTGWGSINGLRLLAALAPAPIVETAIPSGGFGDVCVGSFADQILTINNTGFDRLLIYVITSSSPDFLVPSVTSYPLAVSPGASIDVVVRFSPLAPGGGKNATIKIFTNDLFNPHLITVTGVAEEPRLSLVVANNGSFGNVCAGSFADEPLILNNSGRCPLLVTGIVSSSPEFLAPSVISYPLAIAGGNSLTVPIRFAPTGLGFFPGSITVFSDDPAGPHVVALSGYAPPGKLAVTGSTCFGGVNACCTAERTISICNVGDCNLQLISVEFKRKSPYWKLINSPFPATLHPGSCLGLVIRYKAQEKCPRACELVITSDDPTAPVKTLDLLAYTIWCDCGKGSSCGCKKYANGGRLSGSCCDECPNDCDCDGVDGGNEEGH
jgi:hypothetical protein